MSLGAVLLVFLGGFVGGCARYFLSGLVGRWIGETFPWGTMVVNITGAFLIGALTALFAREPIGSELLRDFAVVGVLGGYTTVSSFSLQTVTLAADGEYSRALFNAVASGGICVLAVAAGYMLCGGAIA
jgi:CrcB protein